MRLHELTEAIRMLEMPMISYGLHGDFSSNSEGESFENKHDRTLVSADNHSTRVGNFFKNIPQPIRIFVANDRKFRICRRGLIHPEKLLSIPNSYKMITGHENTITLIYTGNRESNGYAHPFPSLDDDKLTPMTGWAFGHKLAHMIDESNNFIEYDQMYKTIKQSVFAILQTNSPYFFSANFMNKGVVSLSGRKYKIKTETEFFAELITIYLNKGYSVFGDVSNTTAYDNSNIVIANSQAIKIKAIIENTINNTMPVILAKMVGNIYIVKP